PCASSTATNATATRTTWTRQSDRQVKVYICDVSQPIIRCGGFSSSLSTAEYRLAASFDCRLTIQHGQQGVIIVREKTFVAPASAVPGFPIPAHFIITTALKISVGESVEHREKYFVRFVNSPQVIKCGQSKIGKAGGGTAVFVDLETVGIVLICSTAITGIMIHVIFYGYGNEIARQAQIKARVTDLPHFGQQVVHN